MKIFGIFLSTTDLWLLTIAGVCVAWLISHRLTLSREKDARRIAACQKFQSTILTELSGLYPLPTEWPKRDIEIIDILKAKLPTLQVAVFELANVFPWYKRYFFLKAWRTYRLGKDGQDGQIQDYWQYVPSHGSSSENGKVCHFDNRLTYQSNFKLNIDRLLSYVKQYAQPLIQAGHLTAPQLLAINS